jgi:hypothetical protein
MGTSRRRSRRSRFFSGSTLVSDAKASLTPVMIRKAPKTYSTQWNWISTEPSVMKMPRKISAPRIP